MIHEPALEKEPRLLLYEGSTRTSLPVLTYPGETHRQARQNSLVQILRTFSIAFAEHVVYIRLSRKSYQRPHRQRWLRIHTHTSCMKSRKLAQHSLHFTASMSVHPLQHPRHHASFCSLVNLLDASYRSGSPIPASTASLSSIILRQCWDLLE
ncbi:hypothetical protein VTO73DRAFT_10375 [Trametes versicolor]